MNNVGSNYEIQETKAGLFFKQAYNPLIFSNTDNQIRNVANAAMSVVIHFALNLATLGMFTLVNCWTVYRYGDYEAVHFEDEIDNVTSLINVKELKKAAEESIARIENKENNVDYHAIYLLAVLKQKGIVPEEIDIKDIDPQQAFSYLSTVEFADQWKAALKAADLCLSELIDLDKKSKLTDQEKEQRVELLEQYKKSLLTVKEIFEKIENRQVFETEILRTVYKKLVEIDLAEGSVGEITIELALMANQMQDPEAFAYLLELIIPKKDAVNHSDQWEIFFKVADYYLDQLIAFDKKSELTAQDEQQRTRLLGQYSKILSEAQQLLESRKTRIEIKNRELGEIYVRQFEVQFSENIILKENLQKAQELGVEKAFEYLEMIS